LGFYFDRRIVLGGVWEEPKAIFVDCNCATQKARGREIASQNPGQDVRLEWRQYRQDGTVQWQCHCVINHPVGGLVETIGRTRHDELLAQGR
jgi:hypothetical protein